MRRDTVAGARYSERLYVTWYWWPLPLVAAGLLAAEVHMGYPGVRAWLPYVVLLPLTALLICRAGPGPRAGRDGELWVGRGPPAAASSSARSRWSAARRSARRSARTSTRPRSCCTAGWVGPVVRVRLTDPDDPTPYWVFSHAPEKLADRLRRADPARRRS